MIRINTRNELNEVLKREKELNLGCLGKYQVALARLKSHPRYMNWLYIKWLRIAGYYYTNRKKNILYSFLYFLSCRKKNKLGRKLGIELNEKNIGFGVELFHTFGTVINGNAVIGENCKFHGNNCIGNNGFSLECPIIGNNVRMGNGAKVIGGVTIADDVVIAAGAVVVRSFTTPGVTLAGIPAKVVKEKLSDEMI